MRVTPFPLASLTVSVDGQPLKWSDLQGPRTSLTINDTRPIITLSCAREELFCSDAAQAPRAHLFPGKHSFVHNLPGATARPRPNSPPGNNFQRGAFVHGVAEF